MTVCAYKSRKGRLNHSTDSADHKSRCCGSTTVELRDNGLSFAQSSSSSSSNSTARRFEHDDEDEDEDDREHLSRSCPHCRSTTIGLKRRGCATPPCSLSPQGTIGRWESVIRRFWVG